MAARSVFGLCDGSVATRVHRATLRHAALAAIVLGCAHKAVQSGGAGRLEVSRQGAALEVENNTTLDVRIYLLRGAMPTRLGTVAGMSTAVFELKPEAIDREIRLYANPVAGWRRTITDPIAVKPGQIVSLKLDNMLRSYRLSIW